ESDRAEAKFFVIENPDWVNIIALTKDKQVVLIKQYRQGAEDFILEIPGGMIDENESPEATAKRELLEETGFLAREMIFIGKTRPNPAIQNNTLFHFLAADCEKSAETSFDEHENIETKLVSLDEIENLIASGKVNHSLVIAAFYFLNLYKRNES
ncbi:MAG TPA: NUDIX hydrolase, partial [Pyrinomonadaceae bacterium]|nr:NUDIX hydrolase [Pyrinomonadaceae bacterium]